MSDILSVQNYSSVYHSVPGTKFWDMPAQPVLSHRLMTEAVNHNHHHQVHVLPSCVSPSPWCWTWSASFTMLVMLLSLRPSSLAPGLPGHLFHFLHIQRHVQGNNLNIQDSFLAGSGHSMSGHLLYVHGLLLQAIHLLPLSQSWWGECSSWGPYQYWTTPFVNRLWHTPWHVLPPSECCPSCTFSLWTPITCTIAWLLSSLTLPLSERN